MLRLTPITSSLVALVLTGVLSSKAQSQQAKGASPSASAPRAEQTMDLQVSWLQLDELIKNQQFDAAKAMAGKLHAKAAQDGDEALAARALTTKAELTITTGGYETALTELKAAAWPKSSLERLALELWYAHALMIYLESYSWEINQREATVGASGKPASFKEWTRAQILAEALAAYDRGWREREKLGTQDVAALKHYLHASTYPKGLRDSLRDTLTYFASELLANSAYWQPAEHNELYKVDLSRLLEAQPKSPALFHLEAPAPHPLERAVIALADLEAWHTKAKRPEAALEARLERLRHLHRHYTDAKERQKITAHLATLLPQYEDEPWWSAGMAQLAQFYEEAGELNLAHQSALSGTKRHGGSVGGKLCQSIVHRIEARSYRLEAMQADGVGKRSLAVTHRNLEKLYLRAYPIDLLQYIAGAKDWNWIPSYQEFRKVVKERKPSHEWQVELPKTPDFKSHRTYVVPPIEKFGSFVIVASAREDFLESDNQLVAANFLVSNIVLQHASSREEATQQVAVLDATSGEPVAGADVMLYHIDYSKGHKEVARVTTHKDGRASIGRDQNVGRAFFLIAQKGDQIAYQQSQIYIHSQSKEVPVSSSFIYTDRPIYRPGQKIQWKVLTYTGLRSSADFKVAPQQDVDMILLDANGEKIATQKVKTNAFGSAAGSFLIPAGRLLGSWTLQSSFGSSSTSIRVEEYKRPSFEVSIRDPQSALRLNQKAKLQGEGRYYFGAPVSGGQVNWRVTREPIYPWWWHFRHFGESGDAGAAQQIAQGTSKVGDDGLFELSFLPAAKETTETRAVRYHYRVFADLTDEGGETRSAERSFRLGFSTVTSQINMADQFLIVGEPAAITALRTDLDGTPRAGEASWSVVSLKQPERTLAPADLPLAPAPTAPSKGGAATYQTPGDLLRPRWARDYAPTDELARWADGRELAQGRLTHEATGQAQIHLPSLEPGAYRLRYQTKDETGAAFDTWHDFIVAARDKPLDLRLPAILRVQKSSVNVGGKLEILAHTGLPNQLFALEIYSEGRLRERKMLRGGRTSIVSLPIGAQDRGGMAVALNLVHDHQDIRLQDVVGVPWDDRDLDVTLTSFRDKITPGARESWQLKVTSKTKTKEAAHFAAEILAYMYDKSLEFFASPNVPMPQSLLPMRAYAGQATSSLGMSTAQSISSARFIGPPTTPSLEPTRLNSITAIGFGRTMMRSYKMHSFSPGGGALEGAASGQMMAPPAPAPNAPMSEDATSQGVDFARAPEAPRAEAQAPAAQGSPTGSQDMPLRTNFQETAFFHPQLTLDAKGTATVSFTAPDSVTSWSFWVLAVTKDLRAGTLTRQVRTVKDLMVRPYLPRFLREGDDVTIKVVVTNTSSRDASGVVELSLLDAQTGKDVAREFGLTDTKRSFAAKAHGASTLAFELHTPRQLRELTVKVVASSPELTGDGEQRRLVVLPSRVRLMQSRFVSLHGNEPQTMRFDDMQSQDPSLVHERMVVQVDAQLFQGVLKALPYLTTYPYECSEQVLNRFLATSIVQRVFEKHPPLKKIASQFKGRKTKWEAWDQEDPSRLMSLEESPWLQDAQGGDDSDAIANVLDPDKVTSLRQISLKKLAEMQTTAGGFPWFAGGPPSSYMTLYLLAGFSRAAEFGIELPKDMVTRAWAYVAQQFRDDEAPKMAEACCVEQLTYLNYVASSFPDPSWTANALTEAERSKILDHSFAHWKKLGPMPKAWLALTLKRAGRTGDAQTVWRSLSDLLKDDPERGAHFAPEDRSWLWFNDSIEMHAFMLRAMDEMDDRTKSAGVIQWLFLNKKLNHWKSTRASAEVIYALAHHLDQTGLLQKDEAARVDFGGTSQLIQFPADAYQGKASIVVDGKDLDPSRHAKVTVQKQSEPMMFASASWQFSTETPPRAARGDFFTLTRHYFKRDVQSGTAKLRALAAGDHLAVGDELEVHLAVSSKHAAEYVHLRDPRAAGMEPVSPVSGYRWDLGLSWYEEVRDSATNFFFERLPAGQYTFKYRLRTATAGTFLLGPASLQALYAPEFTAYSAGDKLMIDDSKS